MTESKLSNAIYDNDLESKYFYPNISGNDNNINNNHTDLVNTRKHKKFLLNDHNISKNAMASLTNSITCGMKNFNNENQFKAKIEQTHVVGNNEENNGLLCKNFTLRHLKVTNIKFHLQKQ